MKKLICRVLMCLMVLALLPVQAHAIDRIDTSKDVYLTVHFSHEGQPIEGARLELYKVADISETGELTLLDQFAAYPVMLEGQTLSEWSAVANTFKSYIALDGIQPTDAGVTDETGTVYFPRVRKPMEQGLYLITGDTLAYKGVYYTPAPTLIALPNREKGAEAWDYDVTISQKYTLRTVPAGCTVAKVWHDDNYESERPASVTIHLLKDGSVYDTVKLSAANDWKHTWPELAPEHTWTVAEKTVKGYTVTVTESQEVVDESGNMPAHTVFTVTNTYKEVTPVTPEEEPEEKLPQTGSLWWPVPVLMIAGLGCLIAGVARMRSSKNEIQ